MLNAFVADDSAGQRIEKTIVYKQLLRGIWSASN